MFSKLIGNDVTKLTLRRLIQQGRLPNSLLFVGPECVGKKQFAIEAARALVCREPSEGEACGTCASCQRVGNISPPNSDKAEDFDRIIFSEHPDVGVVFPHKRNVRIAAIRDLEREANFNPYEAAARIFIIDDADLMKDAAANALLKTLEEPPATTHIILVTARPDVLLPTIRSRCQTMHFAPIDRKAIEEYLIETRAFSHDEARLAAGVAHGSIGRAVEIDVAKYRDMRDRAARVLRSAIVDGDTAALLKISEELNDAKNKDDFEQNLDILEAVVRDVWRLACGVDPSKILDPEMAESYQSLARLAAPSRFAAWLGEIETLRRDLAVNINRRVATDAMFLTMAAEKR
ncbi:MAG: DNA polymerase III subunit delta' [Pyrinomonadaceae bacterium]